MGMSVNGTMQVGSVNVTTTQNTGLSIEHWAERLLDKMLFVGNDELYPSPIREQALAYKDALRTAIVLHMGQAIKSDRTTLYNLLLQQGETKMAEILRRLSQ